MLTSLVTLFTLGLSLGSFLGACAYRIPRGISIISTRSCCPNCDSRLGWMELIPLASFMFQRGRCRSCQKVIPWRYPLFEIVVAAALVILFLLFIASSDFLLKSCFFLLLFLIGVIDWDFQVIPNMVLVAGSLIGVTLKCVVDLPSLPGSIIAAFLSFGIALSVRVLANLVLRREGLGMGDVKLAWLLGLFLGIKLFLVTFWAASLLGATYGLLRSREFRSDPLPFGSFLAVSGVLTFTFDETVLNMFSVWF